MIKHELVVSILRFYSPEYAGNTDFKPYVLICTLQWESPQIIWIQGMLGQSNKPMLINLIKFCVDSGIKIIKAHRAPGHRIPYMKEVDDHLELDVAAVARVLSARSDSKFHVKLVNTEVEHTEVVIDSAAL